MIEPIALPGIMPRPRSRFTMNGRGSTPHEMYHVHVYAVAPVRALCGAKGEACLGTELETGRAFALFSIEPEMQ